MPTPVIIDCDPGHDDAVAILLAARHLDVIGITTVGGNQSIEKVTENALKVMELGGLSDVRVARGMAGPLLKEPRYSTGHGDTGLDGYQFPAPRITVESRHAVAFIIDTVMSAAGVALAALGPLTNIAAALRLEPRLRDRVSQISLMGGSVDVGNVTAVAEFNIWTDAEAADIIFRSGMPITMCGLNVTQQATVGEAELERLRANGNTVSDAVADLLEFYRGATLRRTGVDAAYLHDPCAIAALIDPSLFEFEDLHVEVELRGTATYGQTVCDQRFVAAGSRASALREAAGAAAPNARVAMRLDHGRFFELICETLAEY